MKKLKQMCSTAILPTIVVTIIFFLNYYCFGADNTMIAPFATLSFLRFRNITNHYECMLKTWLIYLAMTALAFIAVINLPLCIIVNAFAFFWLAYCLIDEYNPTNYFPAGMALIFFQIAPAADIRAVGIRIGALTASLFIVFLFIVCLSFKRANKKPIYNYIKQGLSICEAQLSAYRKHNTTKLNNLHQELCNLNKQICDEIYAYNRASIRLSARINWYCRYVALFQVINFFTTQEFDAEDFQTISLIFNRFSRQFEITQPSPDYKRLRFRNAVPSVTAFRFRFAMRLVLIITPCMTFAYLSHWDNAYWLVISVFFMMIPVYENTKQRIRQRMAGTIVGIIMCFVLFSIFQQFPGRVALMTLANFMIYASSSYGTMVVYITCSALAIQSIDATVSIILLQRLLYTAIGGVIAFLANKFVFPIQTRKDMTILIRRLDDLQHQLTLVNENNYPDPDKRQHRTDELIIKSYMLMKRLQTYHASLPEDQKSESFTIYERKYMNFMGEYLRDHLIDKVKF